MKNWSTQNNGLTTLTAGLRKVRALAFLSMSLTLATGLQAKAEFTAQDYDETGALIVNFKGLTEETLETGYRGFKIDASGLSIRVTLRSNDRVYSVVSNVPITKAYVCTYTGSSYRMTLVDNDLSITNSPGGKVTIKEAVANGERACTWTSINNAKQILTGSEYTQISAIQIPFGSYNISEDMRPTARGLSSWYQIVSQRLNEFGNLIGKDERPHLTRLKQALADGISLMKDPSDKDGKKFRPVTSDRVREQARVILVLATVLNELLNNHDDRQDLKGQIEVLRNLSVQIRIMYDWNTGLSGSGSKAYSALCEVIDIELRELYTSMGSFGGLDPSIFNTMMRANWAIKRATATTTGGDARSNEQVEAFAKAWNDKVWQQMLKRLINAPQDYQGLVQPKLKLLLMAVESMSHFSGQKMNLDVDSKLSATEQSDDATPKLAPAARKPVKKN